MGGWKVARGLSTNASTHPVPPILIYVHVGECFCTPVTWGRGGEIRDGLIKCVVLLKLPTPGSLTPPSPLPLMEMRVPSTVFEFRGSS